MAFYLDTSAAVKLVVAERGSAALARWAVAHHDQIVASDLLRTELLRATRRGAPDQMERARAVIDSITICRFPDTAVTAPCAGPGSAAIVARDRAYA